MFYCEPGEDAMYWRERQNEVNLVPQAKSTNILNGLENRKAAILSRT